MKQTKLFILLCLFSISNCYSQSDKYGSFYLKKISRSIVGYDFQEILTKDVDTTPMAGCEPHYGFFHFLVNKKGKVEKTAYVGDLDSTTKNTIIKNINGTNGLWVIPKGTSRSRKDWYIFPYFYIPRDVRQFKCTENQQKNIDKFLSIAIEFITIQFLEHQNKQRGFLIMPEYGEQRL